jgi:hypothetical protein
MNIKQIIRDLTITTALLMPTSPLAQTTYNGYQLPDNFNLQSVINEVAISTDGRYAITTDEGLEIKKIPKSGTITYKGATININRNNSFIHSSNGNSISVTIGDGSIIVENGDLNSALDGDYSINNGSVTITSGTNRLEKAIDEKYQVRTQVDIDSTNSSLELTLNNSNEVELKGKSNHQPTNQGGILHLENYNGQVSMPTSQEDLSFNIEHTNGSIDGNVAHPGTIYTANGNIKLNLYAPLAVRATSTNGLVSIVKMQPNQDGTYAPIGQTPKGTLNLKTTNGDVEIKYVGN